MKIVRSAEFVPSVAAGRSAAGKRGLRIPPGGFRGEVRALLPRSVPEWKGTENRSHVLKDSLLSDRTVSAVVSDFGTSVDPERVLVTGCFPTISALSMEPDPKGSSISAAGSSVSEVLLVSGTMIFHPMKMFSSRTLFRTLLRDSGVLRISSALLPLRKAHGILPGLFSPPDEVHAVCLEMLYWEPCPGLTVRVAHA